MRLFLPTICVFLLCPPNVLLGQGRPADGTLPYPLAEALGVKGGDVPIADTIARLVGHGAGKRVFTGPELDQVASVLSDPRGMNFDDVVAQSATEFVLFVDLNARTSAPLKLGNRDGRAALYEQLFKHAARVKGADEARGIRLARLAVVLAEADFKAPRRAWMYNKAPNDGLDKLLILDPQVVSVLALSPREHEAVADLLVQWSTDTTFGDGEQEAPVEDPGRVDPALQPNQGDRPRTARRVPGALVADLGECPHDASRF